MEVTFTGPNWKPSRADRKLAEHHARTQKIAAETAEKRLVRARDRGCRFPLCGCRKLHWRDEVSHDVHKGMGSKDGGSTADKMVTLCQHRHQYGAISRHAGTLRAIHLTAEGYNGPVSWEVESETLLPALTARLGYEVQQALKTHTTGWYEVARETAPGVLEPLDSTQAEVLQILATMVR